MADITAISQWFIFHLQFFFFHGGKDILIFWYNYFSCSIYYFRVLWRLIKFEESISSVMKLEQGIFGEIWKLNMNW